MRTSCYVQYRVKERALPWLRKYPGEWPGESVNIVGSSSESTSIEFEASVEMFDGYLICIFNAINSQVNCKDDTRSSCMTLHVIVTLHRIQ